LRETKVSVLWGYSAHSRLNAQNTRIAQRLGISIFRPLLSCCLRSYSTATVDCCDRIL